MRTYACSKSTLLEFRHYSRLLDDACKTHFHYSNPNTHTHSVYMATLTAFGESVKQLQIQWQQLTVCSIKGCRLNNSRSFVTTKNKNYALFLSPPFVVVVVISSIINSYSENGNETLQFMFLGDCPFSTLYSCWGLTVVIFSKCFLWAHNTTTVQGTLQMCTQYKERSFGKHTDRDLFFEIVCWDSLCKLYTQ